MKSLFVIVFSLVLNIFLFTSVYAEGSGDLLDGGFRAPLNANVPIKVYVEEGETINLGSEEATINYAAPDGTSGSCTGSNLTNTVQEAAGPLPNVGGYLPCTVTVGPGQAGVWYITIPGRASHWDVTVRDAGGSDKDGRVYFNRFVASMGGFSRPFNGNFFVQTNDCYQYQVEPNGLDPYAFQFYANNKGVRDASGNPTYQSAPRVPTPSIHNPESPDTATDVTHKLFINPPDTAMPVSAPIADTEGETWLYCEPVVAEATNFTFQGIEGTPLIMGTNPLGGNFLFDSNVAGSTYSMTLDFDNDGVFDPEDLILSGTTVVGQNSAPWDGLDGQGNPVNAAAATNISIPSSISFTGGEVHFPLYDAEASNGLIITRLNGANAPDNTVYWDHSNLPTAVNGEVPNPLQNLTGLPSGGAPSNPAVNNNSFGIWNGTTYRGTGNTFGDRVYLDTWAFIEIPPKNETIQIEIREADLEVTRKEFDPSAVFAVGEIVTFELEVTNNGPSDASGVKIYDYLNADFTNPSLLGTTVAGGASVTSSTFSGNDFLAVADMPNGSTIVFEIEVEIATLPSNDMLMNTGYIMREADNTDPDATNPDSAVPSDPIDEITASGGVSNNTKDAVLKPVPEIGAAKALTDSTFNADGTITATYDVKIENTGNITFTSVNVNDDLAATFSSALGFSVDSISSADFSENTGFNGSTVLNLLDGTDSLAPGESGIVTFVVTVQPETPAGSYGNTAVASGTTTGGTTVTDDSDNGSDVDEDNDGDPSNNSDPTPFPGFVNLSSSTKEVSDVNGAPAQPGDTLEYTITLINTGNATATGVDVADSLDTNVSLSVGDTTLSDCGGSSSDTSSVTTLAIDDLEVAVGVSCVITFQVTVASPLDEGTVIENSAKISAGDLPGAGANPSSPDVEIDGTPDLSTSEKAYTDLNGGDIEPDDIIQYTVTLKNTGDATGTGINVQDTIDTNTGDLANVSLVDCGTNFSDNSTSSSLLIEDVEVEVGDDCVITYTVTVNNPLPPDTTLTNDVLIGGSDEGGPGAFPSTTTDPVVSLPDLSGSQKEIEDINGGTLEPGDDVLFTITVVNSGNANASGVLVTDAIISILNPDFSSLTYTDCGSAYDSSASTGNDLNIDNLEVTTSDNCVITFEAELDSPVNEDTEVGNVATIHPADEGGDGAVPAVSPPLYVDATPDLSTSTKDVEDVNGNTVEPGDTLTYTITLINSGNGQATGVDVDDVIDVSTENLSNISLTDCGTGFSDNSNAVLLNIDDASVQVGTDCVVTYDVTLKSPLDEGTTINNTATIGGPDEGGPGATPSAEELEIDATPDLSTSTKEVEDVNGGTVEPGDTLTYTITLINSGNGQATGVDVDDAIDTNTQNLSNVTLLNCGTDFADTSDATTLNIDDLSIAVGTNCVITYSVTLKSPLDEGTTINNTATVSGSEEGGPGATPSSPEQEVDATPELSATKQHDQDDNSVNPGDTITYTVSISNAGNGSGTTNFSDTILTDYVGDPTNIIFTDCGSGSTSSFTSPDLEVSNLIIAPGETCEVTYEVEVASPLNEGTVITNTVDVSPAQEGGNNPDPVQAPDITVDATPDLSTSTKDVEDVNDGTLEPGDTLSYTITLVNTGNGTATTSLLDTVNIHTTVDTSSVTMTDCGAVFTDNSDAQTVDVDFVQVEVGTNCVITFEVELAGTLNEDTVIDNTVTIDAPEEGGSGAEPSSPELEVDATPDLSTSTKGIEDVNGDALEPGDTLAYTVTLINTGNGQASGVSISDVIDVSTESLSNIALTGCGADFVDTSDSTTLTIDDLTVEVGASCVITYDVNVKSPVNEGTTINNTATISGSAEGGPGAEPSSPERGVDAMPDLSTSTKDVEDVNGDTLEPGDVLEYTITLINTGDGLGTTSMFDAVNTHTTIDTASVTVLNCGTGYIDNSDAQNIDISSLEVSVGENCVVTFEVILAETLNEGTVIDNTVVISDPDEGGPGAQPSSPEQEVDATPKLSVTKEHDQEDASVNPGDTITYAVSISNTGNGSATTGFTDTIPVASVSDPINITFTDCGSAGTSSFVTPSLNVSAISIASGETCEVTYEVEVKSPLNEGTLIANTVNVDPAQEGGNDPQEESSPEITVDATPDLSTSTKEVEDINGGKLEPGDTLTYTITLSNTGDGQAAGVDIADEIDANTENLSDISTTQCGSDYANTSDGATLDIDDLTIEVDADCIVTYNVNVKSSTGEKVGINNSVEISGEAAESLIQGLTIKSQEIVTGEKSKKKKKKKKKSSDDQDSLGVLAKTGTNMPLYVLSAIIIASIFGYTLYCRKRRGSKF